MFNIMMPYGVPLLIAAGVLLIFLFRFITRAVYLVRQAEAIVIERLGKFDRVLLPGLHFVMPFIEVARSVRWSFVQFDGKRYNRHMYTLHRIDMREAVYDFPKQNVITRDNITMEINALLYYQITDPRAAVYEVSNLPEAIEKLTQTTLRDVIGSMELDESLVSRSMINERLRLILDEATDKWGVKVNRVELQEINPPEDIRHAMEKQMRAERDRRAIILESEGTKRAAILQAEGVKESNMLRAQGEAEAEITRAEGAAQARLKIALAESEAIKMLQNAAPNADPMPYMIAMQYIKALPEMMDGKDDKMILVPYEASSLVGSLATIKKVFEQVK